MQIRKNRSFLSRLRCALAGVVHGLRTEHSLRMQTLALLLALLALTLLRPAALWWALVMLAGSMVLAAEMFNTAIERLADHLHPDLHPQIRLVKDCAAGGVLISALGALAIAIALLVALLGR
jgi:diacylglycerol kinase (ATP)